MPKWSVADIPDLHGRTALVTGANSGIGYHTASQLAEHGARTLLACRDLRQGELAARRISASRPDAIVELVHLDLASLDSIDEATGEVADRTAAVDLLVNNAGVMAPPVRRTVDGFETQFGVNHLGHFALTGRLLPLLLSSQAARVVTVTSIAHRMAKPDFDDVEQDVGSRWRSYGRAKLANLLFALELDRRAKAVGAPLSSIAAHPGFAASSLVANSVLGGGGGRARLVAMALRATAQSSAEGALPLLYAATAVDVRGGEYVGPRGPGELRGAPRSVRGRLSPRDVAAAGRLWELSVKATGVGYEALTRS